MHFTQVIKTSLLSVPDAFFNWVSRNGKRSNVRSPLNYLLSFFVLVSALVLFFLSASHFFDWQDHIWPEVPSHILYSGFAFGVMSVLFHITGLLTDGLAETVLHSKVKILLNLCRAILILGFVYYSILTLYSFFWIQNILFFLGAALIFHFMFKKDYFNLSESYNYDKSEKKNFLTHVKSYSSPLVVYGFVSLLFDFFDRWLLQRISGSLEQGYFSVGYRLSALVLIFTSAMTPVLTRDMAAAFEENNRVRLKTLFRRIQIFYFIAAGFSAFIACNTDIIIYFLGGQYAEAEFPIFLMILYPIYQTFGQLSNSLFLATGQTKKFAKIGVLSMLLGLPLTYFFLAPATYIIPGMELSSTGLAIKMLLWQFIVNNLYLYHNVRFLSDSYSYWLLVQVKIMLVVFTFAFGSSMLVEQVLQFFFDKNTSVWLLLLKLICSGLIYTGLTLSLVLNVPDILGIEKHELVSLLKKLRLNINKHSL